MTAIKLCRGAFGHVSMLTVAGDFVTHAHLDAHIIIWIEGAAGRMTIGGRKVALGPDTAAGINALEPHSHAISDNGEPGVFLAFYIDTEWAWRRRGLASGTPLFSDPAIPLGPRLHDAAGGLLDQLSGNDDDADLAGYEIERFIDMLLDAAEAAQGIDARRLAMRSAQDFRVRKAIELMRANVSERICFDEVARSVGLSRPHFFALFKEQIRLTPNVYWNTLRMEAALRQLQCSEESLTALACNLGFTTQGNFTRFFRDHAGVPPTLYREAARASA